MSIPAREELKSEKNISGEVPPSEKQTRGGLRKNMTKKNRHKKCNHHRVKSGRNVPEGKEER